MLEILIKFHFLNCFSIKIFKNKLENKFGLESNTEYVVMCSVMLVVFGYLAIGWHWLPLFAQTCIAQ